MSMFNSYSKISNYTLYKTMKKSSSFSKEVDEEISSLFQLRNITDIERTFTSLFQSYVEVLIDFELKAEKKKKFRSNVEKELVIIYNNEKFEQNNDVDSKKNFYTGCFKSKKSLLSTSTFNEEDSFNSLNMEKHNPFLSTGYSRNEKVFEKMKDFLLKVVLKLNMKESTVIHSFILIDKLLRNRKEILVFESLKK